VSDLAPSTPPEDEPPLTKPAAEANTHAREHEEAYAKAQHDADDRFNGIPWEKVDPVYRERRLMMAHDMLALGYVQPINAFF
jgi:hypothetical protein